MAKQTYLDNPELYKRYGINIDQAAKWDRLINTEEFRASGVHDETSFYEWAKLNGITAPGDYWHSAQENYNLYYQIYNTSDQETSDYHYEPQGRHRRHGGGLHSGGYNPELARRTRLQRSAEGWEGLLKKAADLEKGDQTYRGPKLASIKSIIEYQRWLAHFSPKLSAEEQKKYNINYWLQQKYHKAYSWQKILEDKKLGLEKITTKQAFLQLRQTNRLAAQLPEDYWEKTADIRELHKQWDQATRHEELREQYRDTNTDLMKKDPIRWSANLRNVGIEHITTKEQFLVWKNADSRRKYLTLETWKAFQDSRSSFETFFKEGKVELEDEIRATEAQQIERTQLTTPPANAESPEQRKENSFFPPAAKSNHRASGETSKGVNQIAIPGYGGMTIPDPEENISFRQARENELSEEEFSQGTEAPILEQREIPMPITSMGPIEDDFDDLQQQAEDQQQEQQEPRRSGGPSSRPHIRQARQLAKMLGGGGTTTATASAGGGFIAAAIETAPIWGTLLLVVIFIIVLLAILVFGDKGSDVIPVTIQKTGKPAVANGETMPFGILVSYPNGAGAVVTDLIPSNATFDTADGVFDLLDDKDQKITITKDEDKLLVRKVRWTAAGASNNKPGTSKIDVNKYKGYGYDFAAYKLNPDDVLPIESLTNVGNDGKQRWEQYAGPAAQQVASTTNMDIGLLGLIAVQESNIDQYAEKCKNNQWDVTKTCPDWKTWEVGYGVKPAENIDFMQEAISNVRADKTNIAQFGRDIITNSKTRNTPNILKDDPNSEFPDGITLDQIIQGAKGNDVQMQRRLGILMKDELISMYLISKQLQLVMDAAKQNNHPLADELEQHVNKDLYKKDVAAKVILSVYNNLSFAQGGPLQGATNFKIYLKPKDSDSYVINKATIIATGITSGSATFPTGKSPIPPNDNTCNGAYKFNNPIGKNFGDPECTLDTVAKRDSLYALLKSIDPVHADTWFLKIVPCESGYYANAYNPTSPAGGAYGLFQMGGPGTANSELDHGDVVWTQQARNAVDYNNTIGNSFKYWECSWL